MLTAEIEASAGALTFDDIDITALSEESILGRLLRTRGLGDPVAERRPEPAAAPAAASRAVLVIEDDPDFLALMRDVLTRGGYEVVTASNGEEAMVQFARSEFALVVTDLAMPGLNGLEVARRCKQARPNVAVVMVTAWESLLTGDDVSRNGVDRVLPKPLAPATLLETIRDVIRPA